MWGFYIILCEYRGVGTTCVGTTCVGTTCVGTTCVGTTCVGTTCVGTTCVGTTCVGTTCVGTTCVGTTCVGTTCVGTTCVGTTYQHIVLPPFLRSLDSNTSRWRTVVRGESPSGNTFPSWNANMQMLLELVQEDDQSDIIRITCKMW